MNAVFLAAGTLVGYRCSLTALVMALPLAILAAWLATTTGLRAPGAASIAMLSVIFEIGFFVGCCIHSWQFDRSEGRERVPGSNPGHSL